MNYMKMIRIIFLGRRFSMRSIIIRISSWFLRWANWPRILPASTTIFTKMG